jgi:hypothetical protein
MGDGHGFTRMSTDLEKALNAENAEHSRGGRGEELNHRGHRVKPWPRIYTDEHGF